VIAGVAGCSAPLRAPADSGEDPCLPDAEGPPGARMYRKLDPQRTGRVTLEQFVAHRAGRFQWLDADADGVVTRAEFEARRGRGSASEIADAFARLDANRDGIVPRAEWDADETQRFEGIDADRDGFVTRDEFLAERRRICEERRRYQS
jgi:EF hand